MDPSMERDAQIHTLEETAPNFNAPILRLIPAIRRRIYRDTCLNVLARYRSWTDKKMYAVLNLNGGNYEPSPYQYNPAYKLGIYGLLVCCRTIYAEVSALLYSSNRFIIRYWEKQSLSPLRALTPSSLSSLTHLKIVLNQVSCHFRDFRCEEDHQGVCCVDRDISLPELHDSCPDLHDEPLDLREAKSKALLEEWRSAAEHISRHISTRRLELCVVCDMCPDDLEGAAEVLEPLRLFSELRNCHIRLSRYPSPQLQRMAHDMALKSRGLLPPDELEGTSQTKPCIGSRLLALPRELRLQILSYTDLITPWKEVEWSRDYNDDGKYLVLYPGCGRLEGLPCAKHMHHGCQFRNCWPAYNRLSKAGIGCFCQFRHSASSSTCMCWVPPTALFLVNRTLLHDAQVVFFSGNRFVVHDFIPRVPWSTPGDSTFENQYGGGDRDWTERTGRRVSEYHSDRLAASIFLRKKVPPRMLRELRELELVFPPYVATGWPGEGHRALTDWAETLCWARDKLNLCGLTLRLVMSDSLDQELPHRAEITSDQVESILSAYRRITSPISILAQTRPSEGVTELRGFYADVTWPWKWNWGYGGKYEEYGWEWVRDYERDRHQELREETESLVLGQQDGTHARNGEQPWISVWYDRYVIKL